MTTTADTSLNRVPALSASSRLRLPLEGGGWNATGLVRQSLSEITNATGALSPMAFLVGVYATRAQQTPPPDAPNELAPRGSYPESAEQVRGANSWRVFLPPQGGGIPAARLESK
jgi:hypothetical protein